MAQQPCFIVLEEHAHYLDRHFREIGDMATWAVSSAKHGNGVVPLRDSDTASFWQSDGVLPHSVDIVFPRLVNVVCVAILLHGRTDDSYTPKRMVIRASCGVGELTDVAATETLNPAGWVVLQLTQDGSAPPAINNKLADFADLHQKSAAELLEYGPHAWTNLGADALSAHRSSLGLFATHLQLCVLENHQQGRDTHIRGIKVFAPHSVAPFVTERFMAGAEIR